MTRDEAVKILTSVQFSPFNDFYWMVFQGCISKNPLIGHDKDYLVIIDGDRFTVYNEAQEDFTFDLEDTLYELIED